MRYFEESVFLPQLLQLLLKSVAHKKGIASILFKNTW